MTLRETVRCGTIHSSPAARLESMSTTRVVLPRSMAEGAEKPLAPRFRLLLRCFLWLVLVHGTTIWTAPGLAADARYTSVTTERLLSPEPRNWLVYRRTYDGWGYSPLDRITPANVASLAPVWTFSTGSNRDHQSPPIVNDGYMFVTTPLDNGGLQVFSLDAATGEQVMQHLFARSRDNDATLMLITHDARLAARCGRTIRMVDGRFEAPAEEFETAAEEPAALASGPVFAQSVRC